MSEPDRKLLETLNVLVLRSQRKKIDRMYNSACDLRDSYPNHLISADEYEVLDTEYGKQYRRAYRRGDVLGFRAHTRAFRKRFRVAR